MDSDEPRATEGAEGPAEAPVTFEDLGLRAELLTALAGLGYEEPTPIQREAVPPLRAGRDLLGQAATGTGKTAAFALPLLDRLLPPAGAGDGDGGGRTAPLALVLVPTRELAVQVSEAVHRYGRGLGARVVPVYGGQPIGRQLGALRRGADVVVATPGRAVDHLQRGTLVLDELRTVVLDEADEMLDMGFAEDLDSLLDACPPERQTVLFSATMPPRIAGLAERHLRDPERIEIGRDPGEPGSAPLVRQVAYLVQRAHKPAALGRILDVESPSAAIVFCRTRHEVDDLAETLNGRGYRAEALHGGMDQEQRDRVMGRLRAGTADLLVATDVAARGLDVEQLTHVVNYDVPSAPEAYVHRIGRVGRAGREGVAITLAEPREQRLVRNIERVTGRRLDLVAVPSVADLRNRRMELTLSTVREALADGDLDRYRALLEALADEADLMDVALAALHIAHRATVGGEDEEEIPEARFREDRPPRDRDGRGGPRGGRDGRGDRRSGGRDDERGARGPADRDGRGRRRGPELTRLYVGLGRDAGIRPGDLVGAIANETRVAGRDIGHIEITDRFSLVEVPSDAVDEVIEAMKRSTIKGRRVNFRRERFTPDQRR
jgi:ATP-dependent RNA helicase DeaD